METASQEVSTMGRPKLLMADDHHLILDALRAMLKESFDVLAVDNGEAFMNAAEGFQPDVALLDVSMPGADGFTTARKILEKKPDLPIMFLSMYADSSYAQRASQVGAKAYLSKSIPAQELISAISAVLDGASLLPSSDAGSRDNNKRELTARQREVLRLIASGASAKDIANQLDISVRTAEFHRAAIMQRLDLHSTAQMTRYALANDLA